MQFLNPTWLYGLSLIAIPIIIHLIHLRKQKTVFFSSTRFIKESENQNRRKIRIRDLLILLLRILTIAMVVLAFAKPVIHEDKINMTDHDEVAIFIDNSFSMSRLNNDLTLLSKAKEAAQVLIKGFPPTTRFRIFTNSKEMFSGRSFDRDQAGTYIEGIHTVGTPASLAGIINQLNSTIKNSDQQVELFLFSDFQNSFFQNRSSNFSNPVQVHGGILESTQTSTLFPDSCWFDVPLHQPGQAETLKVRIKNRSEEAFSSLPIRLEINDTLKAEANVNLPANSEAIVDLTYTVSGLGWQSGRVFLYDYPVSYDNDLYFSYRIAQEIPVVYLHSDDPNSYLVKLFGDDPYFRTDQFTIEGYPIDGFDSYKLVVLTGRTEEIGVIRDRLDSYLAKGGSVWWFLDPSDDLFTAGEMLHHFGLPPIQGVIKQQNPSRFPPEKKDWLTSVLLNTTGNLQLPKVNSYIRLASPILPYEEVLNTESGDHLIVRFHTMGGLLTLSTFPFKESETDLMRHPLIIPLAYLVATGSMENQSLYKILGNRISARFSEQKSSNSTAVKIQDDKGDFESIPEQNIDPGSGDVSLYISDLSQPGIYSVKAGASNLGYLALNLEKSESDLQCLADSLVMESFNASGIPFNFIAGDTKNLTTLSGQTGNRHSLFPFLLIIALICLLLESILLSRRAHN